MASSSGSDPFRCTICMEHFRSRNPRLLDCHHSFCEPCLRKLVKNSQIRCPSCRTSTDVKNNDVTNLSMNFHILPLLGNSGNSITEKICQFCNSSVALFKCEECNQILCQHCSDNHSKMKRFKDHSVLTLCTKHSEGISQICTKCVIPVCYKCLILDHCDHEDMVVGYKEGMKLIHDNIGHVSKNIIGIIKEDEPKSLDAKRLIATYGTHQTGKDIEAKKQFEDIHNYLTPGNNQTVQQKISSSGVSQIKKQSDEQVLVGYMELMKAKSNLMEKKSGNMKRSPSTNRFQGEPKRIANIMSNKTMNIKHAVGGTTAWDDSVIFVDYEGKHVTRINLLGSIVEEYKLDHSQGLPVSVSIHGQSLYISQTNMITQIVDIKQPRGPVKRYKPKVGVIGEACVVSHTKIIYSDFVKGKVYQYDPQEDMTKLVLQGLKSPIYVNTMMTGGSVKYMITLGEDNVVKVYNAKWEPVFTIGKGQGAGDGYMFLPCDVTCTDEGILVADSVNNRICLFDLWGQFVRHLLTADDGVECPRGLVYRPPLLWVICKNKILCFNVNDPSE